MKIEIGESLLLSWLKHIKECQLVQTNWKASYKWELKNKDDLEQLMKTSSELFSQKYGYDIFKGNKSLDQLIGQAEIDVIGISYEENQSHIYAIDVAFHEAGLNYGSKDETVTRVIKKCLRTAMCIYGYFGFSTGTIIFTSPKINPSVEQDLMNCIGDINLVLRDTGLNYKIRIIGNDDFAEKIFEPVLNVIGDVADTSELFMRSLQMYNLFAGKRPKQAASQRSITTRKVTPNLDVIESQGIDGLEEMKIGVIVRTVLRKMLEEGKVSKEEVEKMQTKEYSKETFDIQYPLLQKAALTQGKSPARYYSAPIKIYGEEYFLCSEWFEVPTNNDRPYLMKWLALHK
ncbi:MULTISPECIES: hypothetical protein [unclassified Heyndrickxia]|uniref:hypothetical protein n=1 Tax=unclassified Heyndrickxia TaxID=2837518 RepID=UPI0030F5E247